MTTVAHRPKKGYRTRRLPLAEHEYDDFISHNNVAKARLEQFYGAYPALFPEAFEPG